MKARSRLFSLAMTTSELLPDSPLFSQTFLSARSDVHLNIHEHTHRPCAEGCVKLHAFEVERVSLEVFHLAWPQAWAEVLSIYSNRSFSTPVILW